MDEDPIEWNVYGMATAATAGASSAAAASQLHQSASGGEDTPSNEQLHNDGADASASGGERRTKRKRCSKYDRDLLYYF